MTSCFTSYSYKRANAAFVALVRNNEREAMRDSMRSVEMRFNRRAGYPWIFMNDEEFTTEFKEGVMSMTRSEVFFHVIPKEHWSYPEFINQTYAAEERQKMVQENVIYGGSESYRHMCRFNSMFFFQQKVLADFDWYWRVEPGVEMEANEKVYGFTITLYEYRRHFWSNFEIGDLRFWRSKAYMDYVEFLDKKGGFFYERWGDAPVHSLAVALFLPKDKVIHLDPIAYRHNPYTHCPQNNALYHANGKCECYAKDDFNTYDGYSCQPRWWDLMGKWNY
ncbi:SPOSA6832_01569 [Sporobolomyces salmonicolor]|uniref:SPOSA6832_01569-mRNA-1:cds n=1 Tax=Sporidiobolus salmonicolor TaxID=5005 RepID=A0A0D6EK41_SPOSA|nr:SPOSA6832_01569 [Sporobolomyces salmonicolor]